MDIRKIKKLIELVEESGISELEISEGEESVRISRAAPAASFPVMQQAYAAPMMQQPAQSNAAAYTNRAFHPGTIWQFSPCTSLSDLVKSPRIIHRRGSFSASPNPVCANNPE